MLVLATSTSIASTDMYTPSTPDLVGYFDTTNALVQLTISLNLVAYGIAQLLHGPLSDRFGRRPVMIGSLIAVAILSIACAAAGSIGQLIVARILLGFVAAAMAVVSLAVLKDFYDEQRQVKALALIGMTIAIVPAIAPVIGGYLHHAFGWQSNFLFIAGTATVAALVILGRLPESTVPDRAALIPSRIARRYLQLLRNQDFLLHSLICGVAMGLIYMFITAGPFLFMQRFGVEARHYGFYQAAIVLTFFCGSVLASRLADRWPSALLLYLGMCGIVIGATSLIGLILLQWLTAASCTVTFGIMTFGMGPLFAVGPSRALRSVDEHSGTASSLLNGLQQCVGGLSAVSISLLGNGGTRPIALVVATLTCALLLLLWRLNRLGLDVKDSDRNAVPPSTP